MIDAMLAINPELPLMALAGALIIAQAEASAIPTLAAPIVERMTIEIESRQVEIGLPESFLRHQHVT
ncbi:MAG: hypothetical protein QM705_02035 [Ancrocorticia sp.]